MFSVTIAYVKAVHFPVRVQGPSGLHLMDQKPSACCEYICIKGVHSVPQCCHVCTSPKKNLLQNLHHNTSHDTIQRISYNVTSHQFAKNSEGLFIAETTGCVFS